MLIRTSKGDYVPISSVHHISPVGGDLVLYTTLGQTFHVSGADAEAVRSLIITRPAKPGRKATHVRQEEEGG